MPLESEGLFFLIILVVPLWMGSNPTFKMKDSRVGLVKKLQSFEWPGIHPDLGIPFRNFRVVLPFWLPLGLAFGKGPLPFGLGSRHGRHVSVI